LPERRNTAPSVQEIKKKRPEKTKRKAKNSAPEKPYHAATLENQNDHPKARPTGFKETEEKSAGFRS